MALFIGSAPCAICGKEVTAKDDKVLFPPFVGNTADPLFPFDDAVVHSACLENDPRSTAAKKRVRDIIDVRKRWPKLCSSCGQAITNPDDYDALGHLTDDVSNPLHTWNYLEFHRNCLEHWPNLPRLISLLKEEMHSGRWRGKAMEMCIAELEGSAGRAESKNRARNK